MEITTLVGLILGLAAMMITVMLEGGTPAALINLPAAVIVFGGTFAATLVSFPLSSIAKLPVLIKGTFFSAALMDELSTVSLMTKLAEKARREGLLSLEEETAGIKDDFLRRGVQLVVDGTDPEVMRSILEIDLMKMEARHESGFGILEAMGGFAPTWGIIGTVMGLINVLSNLDDPSNLGHAIAVAFIATLYGVASANLLWLPLGNKLKKKSEAEILIRELVLEGLLSIQAGENPRMVQEKLLGFLAPSRRNTGKEQEGAAS